VNSGVWGAAATLDVDWRGDLQEFVTCSSDQRILVCKVGVSQPLKELLGHTDEVNAVKWDPSCMSLEPPPPPLPFKDLS
jgi:WD40 repeat protein